MSNDDDGPVHETLRAWQKWFRKENVAGNIRCLSEIMQDRHGDDCYCKECSTCTCGKCTVPS